MKTKYKLINKVGEETICDKVTIDGFDYYVSDDTPVENSYGIPKARPDLLWRIDSNKLNLHNSGEVTIYNVIATTNPNIDIPKVVDENLGLKYVLSLPNPEYLSYELQSMIEKGFIEGYNKHKETHPNSDKDMEKFLEWYKTHSVQIYDKETKMHQINITNPKKEYTTKELLELFKAQQPKVIYYQ